MAGHSSHDGDGSIDPHGSGKRPPTPERIRGTRLLNAYIADHTVPLLSRLETKIRIAKSVRDPVRVSRIAREVLSDIVVIALDHAEVFDVERIPRAWLLKIGDFVLRHRGEKERRQRANEISHADLWGSNDEDDRNECDLFDKLTSLVQARTSIDVAETVIAKLEFERLLSLVPPKHRLVLKLAILNDLDGERLARSLQVQAATARQRLHRALSCLRKALERE